MYCFYINSPVLVMPKFHVLCLGVAVMAVSRTTGKTEKQAAKVLDASKRTRVLLVLIFAGASISRQGSFGPPPLSHQLVISDSPDPVTVLLCKGLQKYSAPQAQTISGGPGTALSKAGRQSSTQKHPQATTTQNITVVTRTKPL